MKWFENPDMKYIMDTGSSRQAEPVCYFADPFNDLKRTCILGPELPSCSRLQGSGVAIQ